MTVEERIKALRGKMALSGIDIYIVPSADYHQSEYVGEHFQEREYMTGFTGSAGTAVFTQDEALLWTDGRYFIQARQQLCGTEIKLQKEGEPGVKSIPQYLREHLEEGQTLGFDGRAIDLKTGQVYEGIAKEKNGSIRYDLDLVDEIWPDRPPLSEKPAYLLDETYAGESVESKLGRVRRKMAEKGATSLVITTLDDIGWLLNIRGNDVTYFPLLLSYAIVKPDQVELYSDRRKFGKEIEEMFQKNGIQVYNYDAIYDRVKDFDRSEVVMIDPDQMNYSLFANLDVNIRVIQWENPVVGMKAVKNETEILNLREAHLKDGVAHTKFMYWLKTHVGKEDITEISASKKLEEFRSAESHSMGPSFDPISAYEEHGAIIHYSATPESDVYLEPQGLYLSDTGGHYLEGSTDITRTVALGPISDEERSLFTTTVTAMLRLQDTKFLHGCTGMNLDVVAREPFWRLNLNYNHGTGHGVGYLGNIHEPPQRFSWRYLPNDDHPLEAGMVISDEPGIYLEDAFGIRIENELLVCQGEQNEYGQFLYFEPLTCVPIDLDGIDPEQMNPDDRELLNQYHRMVFDRLSRYLTGEEKEFLTNYTRPV